MIDDAPVKLVVTRFRDICLSLLQRQLITMSPQLNSF